MDLGLVRRLLVNLVLAGAVYLLAAHHLLLAALGLVLGVELYRARRRGTAWGWQLLGNGAALASGWSFAGLIALSPKPATAIGLAAAYGLWLVWLEAPKSNENHQLWQAGIRQFVGLWAIFLAAAIWHWPMILVLILVSLLSYQTVRLLLAQRAERAKTVMALAWALVSAELAWVFQIWLVSYIVAGGLLIIPQAALVITAIGYIFGGIYLAHLSSKLSRRRLAEYLAIGLVILIIVITGTKWNGAI